MELFQFTRFADGILKKNRTSVGIDPGSSGSIRIVVLSGSAAKPVLEYCGPGLLDPSAPTSTTKKDSPKRLTPLSAMLQSGKYSNHCIVVCIPSASIVSNQLEVEKGLSEEELALIVDAEVQRIMPDANEELSVDYSIIEEGLSTATHDTQALDLIEICLCRRSIVDDVVRKVKKCGFVADIVDVDIYALRRMFESSRRSDSDITNKTHAVVECGESVAYLLVWYENEFVYGREMVLHGGISAGISEAGSGISIHTSEQYIRHLLQELGRSVRLFFSSGIHRKIDKIWLSGKYAGTPGLGKNIGDQFNIPTSSLNPFDSMEMEMEMGEGRDKTRTPSDPFTYCVATGLALRGLR